MIKRVIRAKRDRVFAAWTNPEVMSEWFIPGDGKAIVTNDFRLGGSFKNTMIFNPEEGEHQSSCTVMENNTYIHTGEYLEIIPPEKIVFTWSSHLVTNSRVTIELQDLGDSTELTLTHELLDTEDLREKHSGGWEGCLANLANYLE